MPIVPFPTEGKSQMSVGDSGFFLSSVREVLMSCCSSGKHLHSPKIPDIYQLKVYYIKWSGGYFSWRWISSQSACQVQGDKSSNLQPDKCAVWVRVEVLFTTILLGLLLYSINLPCVQPFDRNVLIYNSFSLDDESWAHSLSIGAARNITCEVKLERIRTTVKTQYSEVVQECKSGKKPNTNFILQGG